MSKRSRILIVLGVAVILCGTYLWFFGVQTFFAFEALNIARKTPVVKIAPVELSDLSISQAPGKKLAYFGYEFEVPWADIDDAKTRIIGGTKAIVAFRSGNSLSVWSGSPRELVNSVFSNDKTARETFRQIYGDEALQSDYSFLRIMWDTTPDKMTPFIPKNKAIRQGMLLVMKAISAPRGADSGVFAVSAGEFHGFQFGRPQSSPSGFSVELYSDSCSLTFIFGQKVNGSTVISQPDINRILHTLRSVPAGIMAPSSSLRSSRE